MSRASTWTHRLLVLLAFSVSLPVILLLVLPRLDPSYLLDETLAASQRPLWLVAHPDDEALFFSPSIIGLGKTGKTGHVLSLSNGNADGRGLVRAQELLGSCIGLAIAPQNCRSIDDPSLPDSMTSDWAPADVHRALAPYLEQWDIDAIITFDDYGISGHPNHRALPRALSSQTLNLPVYTLQSSSVLVKFSSVVSLPLTALAQVIKGPGGQSLLVSSPREVRQAAEAFEQHSSQAVWFRTLYRAFSKYLWWNELVPLAHRTAPAMRNDEL